MTKINSVLVAFTAVLLATVQVRGQLLSVSAQCNVFAAGGSVAPNFSGGGGILPAAVSVQAGSLRSVRFYNVTGLTDESIYNYWNGPDGYGRVVDIDSYGAISGIRMPRAMALVGVFVSDQQPASAPPRLDFVEIGVEFESLSPGLNQTFFIGDGRNAEELVQSFIVPEGATQLCLGFVDASHFLGAPGQYGDNRGSLQVSLTIWPRLNACNEADIATEGNALAGPDGILSGVDFDLFILAFYQGARIGDATSPYIADIADSRGISGPDGFVTGTDFDRFIVAFFTGCP